MRRIAIIITALALCASSQAGGPSAELPPPQASSGAASRTGRHLFILSGQSNMHRLDPTVSFTPAAEEAFGKDNVTVAKSAKSGAAVRYWDKDYQWPEGRPEVKGRQRQGKEKEEPKAFGYLYDALMAAVKKQTAGNPYDTVTLIWMQGETDAGQDLADLYIDSFQRFLARLKSDLKIESINVVMGRLSDFGLDNIKIKDAVTKMREIQVAFAEDNPNVEWVNTDDLNDEEGKTTNALHYTEEGYKILGERFAEKAIALIKKQKAVKQ